MAQCFVIQPFDKDAFDKRYEQIFVPAIKAAELEPYRVDKDSSASIPIESIEHGIKDSVVCLADITTDNPNVWYELGFAFACGVPVVMVCAASREGKKYPFDIQHRKVESYTSDAPGDFDALRDTITERLRASVTKEETLQKYARSSDVVASIGGLKPNEMTVLGILASGVLLPSGTVSTYSIREDTEKAGLTKLGGTLAIDALVSKNFIEMTEAYDERNDYHYDALRVNRAGWDWIHANSDKFLLTKSNTYSKTIGSSQSRMKSDYADVHITDDDIPF